MAGATKKAVIQNANEAALQEFDAGLAWIIKQYQAGFVKTLN
jgi:hypothetical protein